MPWPTWDQAALAAVISGLVWLVVRTWPSRLTPHLEPVAAEFAFIAALYSVWRLARMLPIASTHGAIARGHDIATFEQRIHLPSELSLQHFVLDHEHIADFTSWYYATVHVPALIAFLVWMFFRHRDQYPHWRNGLALVTAWCLLIRFIRVAPPRFLPDLGYVDLAGHYGVSIYPTNPDVGVSDQFAAMPSIHIAWAAVVSLGIISASTSRWRWLFLPHLVLTFLVVSATGNHWWMDGIVAVALLLGSLAADTAARAYVARRSADRAITRPEPSPEGLLVRLAEPGQGQ